MESDKPAVRGEALVPQGEMQAQLGRLFRTARRKNKVWLIPLAARLGVSVNMIRWHEAGVRSLRADLLIQAAEIIGVPVSALLEPPPEGVEDEAAAQAQPKPKRKRRPEA